MSFDRNALFLQLVGHDAGFSELIGKKPLLAHYTSIDTVEKILKDEKIWLSNPLFMNDLEELRYGVKLGVKLFIESSDLLAACGSENRKNKIIDNFLYYYGQFEEQEALDIYVFCLSEIDKEDHDGQLPMWRSYGGDGNGAAIVFNTGYIDASNEDNATLLICKVNYTTKDKFKDLIEDRIRILCEAIKTDNPSDEELYPYAHLFLHTLKLHALINKHRGFEYEREWRIIYLKDIAGDAYKEQFEYSYYIGSHGIQPKLIFHLTPTAEEKWKFDDIIERVILGPTASTALAKATFLRMLECIKHDKLKQKVSTSTIPLRPKTYIS